MKPAAAVPMFFGPKHRPLFGWLHRADAASARPLGLVICNPFGYEAICAHRTLRHLAEQAAAAGYTTLRFDYDGSGDSAGSETDPGRLQAWVASVHSAIDTLCAATGLQSVCLIGMRLGSALATLAAATRSNLVGLIAIAPVTKPRTYLRELRALALSRPQPTPPEGAKVAPDVQDIAGFSLTDATRDELAAIDVTTVQRAPAAQVLILHRNDLAHDSTWAEHLQTIGARVQQQTFAGYAEMMLDAHENIVAVDLNSAVLNWLPSIAETCAPPARQSAAIPTEALFESDAVVERAHRMGADERIFSITAEPAGLPRASLKQVVVFLNAGAVSHVGPNRLHVKLARHLAQHAIASLRVDVSGIGETPAFGAEPENEVYTPRALQDIVEIRAYIQRHYPAAEISLVGLCSGAYHGFKSAVSGVKLRRMIAINPLTFFWKAGMRLAIPEFQVVAEAARYRTIALELSSWLRVLRGDVDVLAAIRSVLRIAWLAVCNMVRSAARILRIPLKDDLAQELQTAVRGGVELIFIFAESDPGRQLLLTQGGKMVRRLQQRHALQIEIVAAADHTFTRHWAQARLMDILLRHIGAPPLVR